jgi:hypothetical protein
MRLRSVLILGCLAALPFIAVACGGSPGAKGSTDGGMDLGKPTNEQGMFTALGVDTTTSARTYVDQAGVTQTLPDSYNPLGVGTKTLEPLMEIYTAGRGVSAGSPNETLFDDLKNTSNPTPLPLAGGDESWIMNNYKTSVAADLDGDGIDEIVNIYWIDTASTLHANVIHCDTNCTGNGGNFKNVKDSALGVQSLTTAPTDLDWFRHSFAAADVDGDGKKEIVAVNFGGVDVCKADASFTFTCTAAVTNATASHMSVAAGHFDDLPDVVNDGVVVAWSDGTLGHVSVYDGTPTAFSSNASSAGQRPPINLSIQFLDQGGSLMSFSEALVTAGDIDLDGRDEIVLTAREQANPRAHDLILLDDAETGYAPFRGFRYPLGEDGGEPTIAGIVDNPNNSLFRPALKVFNKTALAASTDPSTSRPTLEKAIYAGSYIFDNLSMILPSNTPALPSNTDITDGLKPTVMSYYETGGGGYNHGPNQVEAGDLDGSGQDTIVAYWDEANAATGNENGFTVATLAKVKWDPGSASWSVWTDFLTTTTGTTTQQPGDGEFYDATLVLANADHDSPTIRYQGKHEELFADPQVLAVLAAAPFYANQNSNNSQTSISFGTGSGFADMSTIGVRTSTSIGYMSPDLFGEVSFSWSLTFGLALDAISSSNVQISQTETWTAGAEDAVVFQVIPFDVYYYTITSSPNAADVGKTMSVNVPRKIDTYKVPVALYNASIVDGPTIGPDILTHTVGDPTSYPKTNTCAGDSAGGTYASTSFLLDGPTWCYASASSTHVGVGTGSVGFQIARTAYSAEGASTDVSVDFSTSADVGGFTFGQSVGFHWGYTYTVDTTQSYNFGGQVGDLPSAMHGYDFGLMVHKGMLAGTSTTYPAFLVDYWVDNAQ